MNKAILPEDKSLVYSYSCLASKNRCFDTEGMYSEGVSILHDEMVSRGLRHKGCGIYQHEAEEAK